MPKWTARQIPDQTGRVFIVTGANSGIGLEAARQLSGAGARVVLACRDTNKAEAAADSIRQTYSNADLEVQELDLAGLESVQSFVKEFEQRHTQLHGLVNNAGIMAIPRRETQDGFEMQFGTNHLGHFALTGLLIEPLLGTPGSRVVNVSSTAHKFGRLDFDDLHRSKTYNRWQMYGQSKLANLLFTHELQRRFDLRGHACLSAACHPGWSATNLQTKGPQMEGSRVMEGLANLANRVFSQNSQMGALPTLFAATSPDVRGGDYIGPGGFQEMRGAPVKVRASSHAHDTEAAGRLWEVSEQQTGIRYRGL